MAEQGGYIYILTNPSFPEYVKIGYADNVDERLAQLNRSECTPFGFRKYAVLHVANRLNPDFRTHALSVQRSILPHLQAGQGASISRLRSRHPWEEWKTPFRLPTGL